jgi:hypothetical protein
LLLNVGLVLLAAELVRRSAGERAPPWLGTATAISFAPTFFNIKHGQTSAILLLGVAGFLHEVERGRLISAGAFLSLTTIKPHVLHLVGFAVIWWTLVERRLRLLVGPVVVLAPTMAVLTLVWPGWWSGYLTALAQPPLHWQAPVTGTLLRLFLGPEHLWLQFAPTALTMVGLLTWLLYKRPSLRWPAVMTPLLLLSVPTASYGWSFDQLVLLVPHFRIVSLTTNAADRRRMLAVLAGVGVILALQITLSILRQDELYQFWMPWALGGLYLWARRLHRDDPSRRAIGI